MQPRAPKAALLALVLMALFALVIPTAAYASSSYALDELSTEVNVREDGSVHVVQRQVVAFDGASEGLVWYLHEPEEGESLRVNVVRAVPVDDGGTPIGDWVKLRSVDVDVAKQGVHPGGSAVASLRTSKVQPWYSYRLSDGIVRSYFPARDGRYLVEADFTLTNHVWVYRDVAELYWRYADESLPVEAHDVTLQVTLPVEEGALLTPDQDVRAWGHGPHDGSFLIGDDGTVIYHVDLIKSGEYAEAHVLFPASLMTNLRDNAPHVFSSLHLQEALAAEGGWVDAYSREANWDNQVRILFLSIAALVILAAAVCLVRFGRTYRSRRALIRAASTLGIVALAANLFFREPLTVVMLLAAALIVLLGAPFLPSAQDAGGQDPQEGGGE